MWYLSKEYLVGLSLPFSNESTNNLSICLNYGLIRYSNLFFFGCAVISDLYLFQETVLLNYGFIFSKN